jgi:uncharacterized protein (DUF697 family)
MPSAQKKVSTGSQREALAALRLLAKIATAAGPPSVEERQILADSLEGSRLPAGITSESLLTEDHDIESLIGAITSEEGRDATFGACFAMAHADRECSPGEQDVIDRLAAAWSIPPERQSVLDRVLEEARDTVWVVSGEPIADPRLRASEIHGDIVKYSVISAVLGLNPIPVASIATELAVVGLQVKMFSDIGRRWGHSSGRDAASQVAAGIGIGTALRVATNALVKLLPGAGSAFAATTNFASTWALGQVANQYWESGGELDAKMLRDLFVTSRSEGRLAFDEHKATVERVRAETATQLDLLASDLGAGRLTLAEYQAEVAALE